MVRALKESITQHYTPENTTGQNKTRHNKPSIVPTQLRKIQDNKTHQHTAQRTLSTLYRSADPVESMMLSFHPDNNLFETINPDKKIKRRTLSQIIGNNRTGQDTCFRQGQRKPNDIFPNPQRRKERGCCLQITAAMLGTTCKKPSFAHGIGFTHGS